MRIKFLLPAIVMSALLLTQCKKNTDNSTTPTTPVTADQTAPVITVMGSLTVSVPLNTSYTDAGATAIDNVDGTVAVTSNVSATNPKVSALGNYTITYTASDKAGNVAHATRTVSVVSTADVTPPVITLNGSSTVSVTQGATYTDAGATATDNVDGTVAVTSNVSGTNPNVAVISTYTITYSASDHAGNVGHATRTVNVVSGSGYSRADYLWSKSPYGYYVNDSDITAHQHVGTYNGYNVVAGSGANDIEFQYFNGNTQSLYATVNGAIANLNPSSQSFYPYNYSGSGTLNSAKNKITFTIHDSYQNHDHLMVVYKY